MWAPDCGPKARISATNAPPVAIAFASRARPTFPVHRRSPMMPDPTTAMSRKAVATNSVKASCATGRLSGRHRAAAASNVMAQTPPNGRSPGSPPHRADVTGGLVADGEHEIHHRHAGFGEFVPALTAQPARIEMSLFEQIERQWVDRPFWK